MPWSNRHRSADTMETRTGSFVYLGVLCGFPFPLLVLCASALVLVSTIFLSAAPEKHLSVYSVAANYSLPLTQREGHDYVGLLELLEPLGKVTAKSEGARWRLRYNNVDGEFQVGKTRARIQGREADLGGKFFLENNR